MNPITPQDLFSPDFTKSLSDIKESLEGTMASLSKGIDNVKTSAKSLANTKFTSTQAEETKKWANSVLALNDEYRYLLQQFNITKSTLAEITTLERDQNAILKLQSQYANAAEGSFNKLSAEYRLLKITMNAMNQEALGNTEAFKKLQKRAEELYQTMNKYQQSTGKFGMQVGDYSKALNGLQLSTQQIVREMPTLANSLSQFFMAISNNVPIFVDNFKRAQKEMGSFTAALKGTLTSLISWQTVLIVLLTVLPKIAKAIHDKRKAQQEANKETKEAFNREKELLSLEENIAKSEAQSVARLKTLYAITQDTTRSLEERTEATKTLKELYPDHLANLSNEAILAGDASTAVDELTNSLILQARARGYLNEIETLSQQKAQKEIQKTRLEKQKTDQETALEIEKARTQGGVQVMGSTFGATMTTTSAEVGQMNLDLKQTQSELSSITQEIDDIGESIDTVIKLIPTEGFDELFKSGKGNRGGRGTKEKGVGEIPDYIIEYYDAIIAGMDEGLTKQMLQLDKEGLELGRERVKIINELEQKEAVARQNNDTAKLAEISASLERYEMVYEQRMANIRARREAILSPDATAEELTDPLAEVRKAYVRALEELRQYTDTIQEGLDSGRKISGQELSDWQDVIRKKILAEAEYQKAKKELELRGQLDAKQISEEEYNDLVKIETAKIDAVAGKALSKVGVAKGKRWNIWTALFGTDVKDEATGTITRVIGEDVKFALDQTANGYKKAIGYIDEYINALQREAEQAIETARTEADLARTVLEAELEAKANGYANSVDLARKEYEEKLMLQEKAQKESEKIQKMQLAMESLSQAANLTTATTSIIASYAKLPGIGQALAIAAIAAMWGTFLTAKAKALQVTKYGEGMSEYLDYGGSHASGNDIDFGVAKDGRRRRVERGEVIGVINKRRVSKYGASTVTGIIDSLNKGTFEYKYGNAFRGADIAPNGANLSHLENGVDALVRQGEYRETVANGRRIIQYKNLTRTMH